MVCSYDVIRKKLKKKNEVSVCVKNWWSSSGVYIVMAMICGKTTQLVCGSGLLEETL